MESETIPQSQLLLYQIVKIEYSNMIITSSTNDVLGEELTILNQCLLDIEFTPIREYLQ